MSSIWTCRGCGEVLCPQCYRAARHECTGSAARGTAAGATGDRATERDEHHDVAVLAEEYAGAPAAGTMQWAPRALRERVAAVLRDLLADAILATQLEVGTPREALAHRLAWAAPSLLLRPPPGKDAADEGQAGAAAAAAVRSRVQLAEAADWQTLLQDALRDRREHRRRAAEAEALRQPTATDEADALRRGQAAVNKVHAGNLRGAVQVLTGEGVADGGPDTEAKLRALVLEDPPSQAAREQLRAELEAATKHVSAPRVTVRALRRRMRAQRTGAAPGASGWRNSHLSLVAEAPGGVGWLAEWVRIWCAAMPGDEAAALWCRGVLVPLRRADGKVRPIALTEALLKLAESVAIDAVQATLRLRFAGRQFSVREPAGAEVVVGCLRQRAWQRPGEAIVATDLTNAYGCMCRAAALRAVARACPQLLGILTVQWAMGRTTAWVGHAGAWASWKVDRGTWQGSPAANPVFCLALQEALEEAAAAAETEAGDDEELRQAVAVVLKLAYADDAFLLGEPRAVALILGHLERVLAEAGWTLVWSKSHGWVPGTDEAPATPQRQQDHGALFALVQRCTSGMPVLGSAADGEHALRLGTGVSPAQPAEERASAGAAACQAAAALPTLGLAESTLHAAWLVLARSAARRLDYDARMCAGHDLAPALNRLDAATEKALAALVGRPVTAATVEQARLPGPLGGLGLRGTATAAEAHYAARVLGTRARVMDIAGGDSFVDDAACAAARERLRAAAGVLVADDGAVTLRDAELQEVRATPWAAECAARLTDAAIVREAGPQRLASRIMAASDAVAAARMWQRADATRRTRLLEAGGLGSGTVWSIIPEKREQWLTDARWRAATQCRLGVWGEGLSAGCQHATSAGHVCGEALGGGPLHALDCVHAPARLRVHRAVCVTLADQVRRAGADVNLEVAVPELARWWRDEAGRWQCQDAVLDVRVDWPGAWLPTRLIDVTVRDPEASRYQPRAAHVAGYAAARAAAEKEARYPAHHGMRVEVMGIEPLGRVGAAGLKLLDDLSADAAAMAADRAAGPALRRRWRHAVEFAVTRSVADALLHAAGRAGTTAWERGAAPRLGREVAGPPGGARGDGRAEEAAGAPGAAKPLTPAQRERAAASRLRALAARSARWEAEAEAAEAAAAEGRGALGADTPPPEAAGDDRLR